MSETMQLEQQYSSGVYSKRDVCIVRGQGARLWDENGRDYVDCVGAQGAANLGHAHPKVVAAIQAQAAQLIASPELFFNPLRAEFQERLVGIGPANTRRVFLCNSGTEAIESAIKFARVSTGRSGVVAAMRGFHGRTLGALSATWNKKIREAFEPLVPHFSHVPYNNLEKLAAAVDEKTAAVILEVVQGEGGVHVGEADFLQGAQALCRERGALLILDEVQTGFGRTGKLLAGEHFSLEADLICLAKSIASGLPMGAVLIGQRLGTLPFGAHGSTFGGNPLACAAGLAVLEVIEDEGLAQQAAEKGVYLMAALRAMDSALVREVRGIGLMVGIEIKQKVAPYLADLSERGVLALPAGLNVIRLLPPLVISYEQLDAVVAALQATLAEERG